MHLPKTIDQYQDHGKALVEESTITLLDYAKTLPANKQEKYAKEFNSLYQSRFH